MKKTIFIIIGASGSGKTDLIGKHLKSMGVIETVSVTTRKMREGEVEGVSYYFRSQEIFDKIDKVEYSNYAGNSYCLSRAEVESKFKEYNAIFAVTDINGARQVKEQYPDETITIFVSVTYDEMIERMKKRGDSLENIAKRVSNAIIHGELDNGKYCDYIVRNDNPDDAIRDLERIVKRHTTEAKVV